MKKLYSILLAFALVLGIGAIASAASTSYTAVLQVTYTSTDGFAIGGDTQTYMDVDFAKTFSDTVSAGVVGEIDFYGNDIGTAGTPTFAINGHGYVTVTNMFGFLTMTAQTAEVDPGAGNICGYYSATDVDPSAGVVLSAPLDPVTMGASFNTDAYSVSAGVSQDLFSFNGVYAGYYDGSENGFAVWGSVGNDALKVSAEYDFSSLYSPLGASAYFIEGIFNLAETGLSGKVGYEGNTPGWVYTTDTWQDDYGADTYGLVDMHLAKYNYSDPVIDHMQYQGGPGNLYGSVSYDAIPDLLTVTVNGQYWVTGAPVPQEWETDGNLGFDLGGGLTANLGGGYVYDINDMYNAYANLAYQATDALQLTGYVSYYALGSWSGTKVGTGLSYTFDPNVVGTASFDYQTADALITPAGYTLSLGIEATL